MKLTKIFNPITGYLKAHLTTAKTADEAKARVLSSLNIVGRTLLIVGLCTSFTFIIPTVLQITGVILPYWGSIAVGIAVCALMAMLIDLSLGVNVPFAFTAWGNFFAEPTWRSFFASLPITLLVYGQCSLSMYFTYHGNTSSTEWLLQHENPKHQASVLASMDSTKNASAEQVRKVGASDLEAAKKADNENKNEAAKIVQTARYNAVKKYPRFEIKDSWDKREFEKAITKAQQDSAAHRNGHGNKYDTEKGRLDLKVEQSIRTHQYNIDAFKVDFEQSKERYNRKLKTYRLLLRDLGTYATLGFVIIVLIITLIQGGSGQVKTPKRTGSNPANNTGFDLGAAKKHLTTYIDRMNKCLDSDGNVVNEESFRTNASALLSSFSTIEQNDFEAYEAVIKRYASTMPNEIIWHPADIVQKLSN